jgi:flagellar hook assembly protein FlgD
VTARVVDVAGRVVRTLIDRTVERGEHSLIWDGRTDSGERAASGVYFVRLESFDGSKTEEATQKLILLH